MQEIMQIILDQQMFLDHLVNVGVVIGAVKINKAQTLPWRVLNLRRRHRRRLRRRHTQGMCLMFLNYFPLMSYFGLEMVLLMRKPTVA